MPRPGKQLPLQAREPPLGRADHVGHWRIGFAHDVEDGFGRDATVHHPDAARLAVLALDAVEKVAQCRAVCRVAGQDLVGQRQALGRHDQRDDHLHAVWPMIPRVAEATLVVVGEWRVGLEIRAGQIVEEHVEADVEQIAPAAHQVVKQRLLVLQ